MRVCGVTTHRVGVLTKLGTRDVAGLSPACATEESHRRGRPRKITEPIHSVVSPPLQLRRHRHGVPSRTSGPNPSPGLGGPAVRSRPRPRPQLRSPDSGSTHPSMSQTTDQASQSTGRPTRRCDFTRIGKHTGFVPRHMHLCVTKNRFMLTLLKRETTQPCPRHQ